MASLRDRVWFPNLWFDRPIGEDPETVFSLLDAKDATVFSIAGYGYPLVFASYGAERVLGIDASPLQIGYAGLQAALVVTLQAHEIAAALLEGRIGELVAIGKDRTSLSAHLIGWAARRLQAYFSGDPRAAAHAMPYLVEHREHAVLRAALEEDRVALETAELLDALNGAPPDGFDALFISSVRNWTFAYGFEADRTRYEEHDRALSEAIFDASVEGAPVLESRIIPVELFKEGGLGDLPGMTTTRVVDAHYLMRPV